VFPLTTITGLVMAGICLGLFLRSADEGLWLYGSAMLAGVLLGLAFELSELIFWEKEGTSHHSLPPVSRIFLRFFCCCFSTIGFQFIENNQVLLCRWMFLPFVLMACSQQTRTWSSQKTRSS
jgi:hypothetical protein